MDQLCIALFVSRSIDHQPIINHCEPLTPIIHHLRRTNHYETWQAIINDIIFLVIVGHQPFY